MVDEVFEDLVEDPELLGLLRIDCATETGVQPLQRRTQGCLQFLGADAVIAHRGDDPVGCALGENITYPPDAEGQDQKPEQDLDDKGAGARTDSLEHGGRGLGFADRGGLTARVPV